MRRCRDSRRVVWCTAVSKLRAARLTGSKASHIGITRGILGQRLRNAGLARQSESRNPPRRAGSPLHLLYPPSRTLCVSLSLSSSDVSSSIFLFSSPPRFFLSLSTASSPIQFLLLLLFTLPFPPLPLRLRTSGAMRSLRAFVRPTPISLPPFSSLLSPFFVRFSLSSSRYSDTLLLESWRPSRRHSCGPLRLPILSFYFCLLRSPSIRAATLFSLHHS